MTQLFNRLSNKLARAVFLALILALQSSCVSLSTKNTDLNAQIDQLLKENRYSDINKILLHTSTKHPQYKLLQGRKNEIAKKQQRYITKVKAAALKNKKQHKWQLAINLYNSALARLEGNKELLTARSKLIEERNFQVNELRKKLLLRRANELVQYQSIYEKLTELIPEDDLAARDISQYMSDKQELAEQLKACADHAISIHDYFLAEKCLKLSNQLEPSNTKKLLLAEVSSKKDLIRKYQEINMWMAKYKSYYENDDLASARRSLQKIISIDARHVQAKRLMSSLRQKINQRIELGLQQGKQLYSKGLIKQALAVWQSLKPIAENNTELNNLISRAQKVDKNLQELKKHH